MEPDTSLPLSRRAFLLSALGVTVAAALPAWLTDEAVAAEASRIASTAPSQTLLRHSLRIGTLFSEDMAMGSTGYWVLPKMLSDHKQLVVQHGPKPPEYVVFVRDLKTGKVTHLDRLAALFNRSFEADERKDSMLFSPDGRYFLWSTYAGVHLAAVDGLTHHFWPGIQGCHWIGDSQHWCSWEENSDEDGSFVQALHLYSVDGSQTSVRKPLAPDSLLRLTFGNFGSNYVITPTHLLATNWYSSRWHREQGPIEIAHLGYKPEDSAVYEAELPEGMSVTAMSFAPLGEAIAWILIEQSDDTPDNSEALPENRECSYTLMISDATGRKMRQIGSIRSTLYPQDIKHPIDFLKGYADFWGLSTWRPSHFFWLPDSHQLSFAYDRALWLVITETQA